MELKQYLLLARKWLWLLVVGVILGGAVAYIFAARQPVVYQTQTRIMVSRASEQDATSYYSTYNDIQLAKTYAQLITTEPVLKTLSERLGYKVSAGQIRVEQVTDSYLLQISVTDGDPTRAAEIANTLVEVFIQNNENAQNSRYESSEQTLQAQITQVESQIAALQTEMSQVSEKTLETQKQQASERIKELERQMNSSEEDIIQLENQITTFFPTPAVTNTPVPSWYRPPATSVPNPTPTLSAEAEAQYRQVQLRLEQAQYLRDLYKQVYANLLTVGTQDTLVDPASRQDQLQATLALYQQIYSNLLSSYENVRLARLRSTPNITQLESAPIPGAPIQPQPLRSGMLGAASGLLIMGAIAFLVEYLDDTLKTPEDITRFLNLPVIGLIGEMDRSKGKKGSRYSVYLAENPLSPIAEAFRTLRTNLDFAGVDKPIKTLLITSTGPSEGKSTISTNLAVVMAQGEKKVVLVDADLRRPTLHRYMQIANRRGLTDLFRDQVALSNIITPWGEPPVAVLTSGGLPPNPAELLGSEKMTKILSDLKGKADIVILDSPPCIIADPMILSAKVDGVLLVIEPGHTKIGAAQVVMEQLQRAGARVVGVVLNPISQRRGHYYSKYRYYSSYYYYSRGYGYYTGDNGNGKSKRNGKQPKEAKSKVDAAVQ
jgi:polysaccharide biosynthesis transport protein